MAKIYEVFGTDARSMAFRLCEAADLMSMIGDKKGIAIKPNLVVASPADRGATTHPEAVEGVIQYLRAHGREDITIMEGSWVGASTKNAFEVCGYNRLAAKYALPIVDLKKDAMVEKDGYKICRSALESGFIINMPVIKGHCQVRMTCALKNLKGCISDGEKRRFHSLGLNEPIAGLSRALKIGVTIADGICGDLDFEEGGTPTPMGRMLLGADPVTVDSYVCALMGYQLDDVPYIRLAERYGVGSTAWSDEDIVRLNTPEGSGAMAKPGRVVQRLEKLIAADSACSACYASLIHALSRMDEEGTLRRLPGKIYIGQGLRGKAPGDIGIGRCASLCRRWVGGCPPTANEVREFLESL